MRKNWRKKATKTLSNSMEQKIPKGLKKKVIKDISGSKNEPEWMLKYRLAAFEVFQKKSLPKWSDNLKDINFDEIQYYLNPVKSPRPAIQTTWNKVPQNIRGTFEELGVPETDKNFMGGTGAQLESEMVYHSLKKELEEKGVIFESTDIALKKYPDIFKKHFGTVVPPEDNKFAALNAAVWSGGSFVYIPKKVKVDLPLHAYFRMNAERTGQFERTLIIADEGAQVNYMEGCTALSHRTNSLHAAVVEIIAKKGAKVRYTTIQNWSKNIYNLVTKRAHAYSNSEIFWLDCNMGSKLTMKYPAIYLKEKGAKGEIQSLALAEKGQHQDTGAKIFHMAANTSSKVVSKSISKDGGKNTYRGLIKTIGECPGSKSYVSCDTLLLGEDSTSDTYPLIQANEEEISIAHEATVSRVEKEQLFYLMSRGLNEEEATSAIINGFANPIINQLPPEYALEVNRLLNRDVPKARPLHRSQKNKP